MRIIIALAFFSQWSGNGIISYYLNRVFDRIGITSETHQLLINGLLQIWNLAWALAAASMVDKIGRRVLFITSTSGMLLFYTLITACSGVNANTGSRPAAHAVIAFVFLFNMAYAIAYSPLIVSYTVEILPYALRAKGFIVFNFAISLSLIFNQYVNPVALDSIGWKYYIVYCCWLVFELGYVYLCAYPSPPSLSLSYTDLPLQSSSRPRTCHSRRPPRCSMVRRRPRRSLVLPTRQTLRTDRLLASTRRLNWVSGLSFISFLSRPV